MIAIKLQEAQWTTTSPIPSSFKKNCINSFASLSTCINSLLSCSLLLICFINYWGGQLSREVISTHKHLSTFCLLEFFSPSEWNLLEINTGTVVTFTTPDVSITQHYVIYMMNLQPSWYKIHKGIELLPVVSSAATCIKFWIELIITKFINTKN